MGYTMVNNESNCKVSSDGISNSDNTGTASNDHNTLSIGCHSSRKNTSGGSGDVNDNRDSCGNDNGVGSGRGIRKNEDNETRNIDSDVQVSNKLVGDNILSNATHFQIGTSVTSL